MFAPTCFLKKRASYIAQVIFNLRNLLSIVITFIRYLKYVFKIVERVVARFENNSKASNLIPVQRSLPCTSVTLLPKYLLCQSPFRKGLFRSINNRNVMLTIELCYHFSTLGFPFTIMLSTGFNHIFQVTCSRLSAAVLKNTIIRSNVVYLCSQCWSSSH